MAMYRARGGLFVVSMLITVIVQPAASDNCGEADLDAHGKCPSKPLAEPRKPLTPPLVKPVRPPPPVRPRKPPVPATPTNLIIWDVNTTGARVSLDYQFAGCTPLTLETTPGRHLVEVNKDGYYPYSEWVVVKAGETRVPVTLVPMALQPTTPPTVAPPTGPKPGSCPAGMVRVPAGTFRMGSPDGVGAADEQPQHEVTLSAYCIDKTEVTVKAYAACVVAKGCSLTTREYCNGTDLPDYPIDCVNWNQATAYCTWAGNRLPSEAEWEYAARGNYGRVYPWGNEAPTARHRPSDSGGTSPVGCFPGGASPFGVLDMAGSVSEWTADWYDAYSAAAVTNPRGPTTGTRRVLRGGGRNDGTMRAAFRLRERLDPFPERFGFRCAHGD